MANEISDDGSESTIYLGLIDRLKERGWSANFEWYDMGGGFEFPETEKIRKRGQEVDLSDYPVIKSPPGSSVGSSTAVAGKYLYIVGGRRVLNHKVEDFNHLYCLDTTAPEFGWIKKAPLPNPRYASRLVPLDDKLYCFGNSIDKSKDIEQWATVYDIKDDSWSALEIQPTGQCKRLPWDIAWHAVLPDSDMLLLMGEDRKLYCCDVGTYKCDLYDGKFFSALDRLVDTLEEAGDPLVCAVDSQVVSHGKPAQDGRYLYLPGNLSLYCYDLLEKAWLPAVMPGFDRRTNVLPSPARPTLDPLLMIFNLGRQEFCVTWCRVLTDVDIVYWTKFVISTGTDGSGIPTASQFSTTKRFLLPDDSHDVNDCFAVHHSVSDDILPTRTFPPSSGTSKKKKKNKKQNKKRKIETRAKENIWSLKKCRTELHS